MAAAEVISRVHEQMWTTAETMRRRIISLGDEASRYSKQVQAEGERMKEAAEPALLDAKDYVATAYNEKEPFHELKEDDRHTIIEMYLGISMLLVGLSLGQLAGATGLAVTVFQKLMGPGLCAILMALLPVRLILHFRKSPLAASDDTERRVTTFTLAFQLGLLAAGVVQGQALLTLAPSLGFIAPAFFALTVDNELLPLGRYSTRQSLLLSSALFAQGIAFVLALPLRTLSLPALIFTAVHGGFLTLHVQLVLARQKEKTLCVGTAQVVYVVSLCAMQVIFAYAAGSP